MAEELKWPVVLVCPGESELSLLAELSRRRDARLVAVIDPDGSSVGAGLAEVMRLPVLPDLASLAPGSARYLVHPPLNETVAAIVDQAEEAGLEAITAVRFQALLRDSLLRPPPPVRPAAPPPGGFDFLESETAAIHRTLSRIEEALDREALLRWLLGLATRATGAGSGSIMLYDPTAGELYLAFAHGLSQKTLHRTRQRLGEGIAGRVALSREAELVAEDLHPGGERDRSGLRTAICAPVTWEGLLLGVLNLSSSAGEPDLDERTLELAESLTHRFGMILDRFLRLQSVHDRQILREVEEGFAHGPGDGNRELGPVLESWCRDLAGAAGADRVTLGVLTLDGDLLESGPEGTVYLCPPDAHRSEVLATGSPLVLRPGPGPGGGAGVGTIFHLPVGRDPARAVLSLEFSAAAGSHRFHGISGEIIFLVNRHLGDLLNRAETTDQVDRLTSLAGALSDLGAPDLEPALRHERYLAAACRLTGADQATLLTGPVDPESGDDALADEADLTWRLEASRLLQEAGRRQLRSSILMPRGRDAREDPSAALLVVPLEAGTPFPGLVLRGKRRLHALDGAGFTEFDALFARRLLPMLAGAAGGPPDGARPQVASAAVTHGALVDILRREMDRCDRYHTLLGVAAFRLREHDEATAAADLVADLARGLRSTDVVGALDQHTLLVIVPEDIQSLPRLRNRVVTLLTRGAADRDPVAAAATAVYPGPAETPEQLLAGVLAALA